MGRSSDIVTGSGIELRQHVNKTYFIITVIIITIIIISGVAGVEVSKMDGTMDILNSKFDFLRTINFNY